MGPCPPKAYKPRDAHIDVSDGPALTSWVRDAADELGGLDILVANVSALAIDATEDAWRKEFEVDMMHTVRAVQASMPYLEQSDAASIVIISSVSGVEIDFAAGPYGVFKAALINYAKGLSCQLAAKGIRVNAVSPGNTYFEGGVWNQIEENMPDPLSPCPEPQQDGTHGHAPRGRDGHRVLGEPRGDLYHGHQSLGRLARSPTACNIDIHAWI